MNRWRPLLTIWILALNSILGVGAAFKLGNGDILNGELADANAEGILVRLDAGGFSQRTGYARFTDETLIELAKLPKSRKFVEPFLAPPAEEIARQEAKQISVKQPSRVERPSVNRGIFSAFTSPNGLILLGALFLSNLYAAFTIARFRHRPAALVCGVSAVMPLIGPVIFLALPKAHSESAHADEGSAETATVAMAASTAENRVGGTLGIGREKSVAEGLPRVFPRGEFTFNKRFFETQFPSFFRVVTSESDRDLVIDVAAGKNSLIASRISRISSNEIHFKNTAGHEMGVNFSEITGITLRNKDQK